jgi:SNF2 family DNA or RNA helicase
MFIFSIIFSCWTRTLDLVSVHLARRGISYQRIDGDQVLSQRQYNMDRFVSDERVPILLMSTGVGAFGSEVLFPSTSNHTDCSQAQLDSC